MALKPNMNTYAWNEYYLILAAALLPAIGHELGAWLPELALRVINILTVGVLTTLAFVREPRKPNEAPDEPFPVDDQYDPGPSI